MTNAAPRVGDVLHHPAFGFATIEDLDANGVGLRWQRQGPSHPVHVSTLALAAAYRLCRPDGLLARSVRDPDEARALAETEPLGALALLLSEVGGPLEQADVRDWYLSLGLISTARFNAAWDALRPLIEADPRFTLVRNQLVLADGVDDERLLEVAPRPLLPPGTVLAGAAFGVGIRLARALAEVHHAGSSIVATRASVQVVGDRVLFTPRPGATPQSRRDDVRFVARLLLDQVVGPLPPPELLPSSQLVPLLGALPKQVPLELMAVLTPCLAADPQLRPSDGFALWEQLHAAESVASLRVHAPWAPRAPVAAGFDTHIGTMKSLQSQTNQDSFVLTGEPSWSMVGVADGISQCNAGSGDLASGLTVRALRTWWGAEAEALRDAEPTRILKSAHVALERANETVCEAALKLARHEEEDFIPMGTTLIMALTRGNRVQLIGLGDSRAYLVGRHGVSILTSDQNLQSERIREAVAGQAVDWTDPGSPLVGYVGHYAEDGSVRAAPTAVRTFTLLPGEWLILCSDGLTDYAAGEEAGVTDLIGRTVQAADGTGAARAMAICRALTDAANRGGGGDNVTVLALTLSADRVAPPPSTAHPT